MDILSVLRRLRPLLGEAETRRAWEQLQLADAKTAKLIEFSLRRKLAQETGSSFEDTEILLDPIPADLAAGNFPLGTVYYAARPRYAFALRRDELIQHTAIFGRSGAGKTNVAFLLLRELSRARVPFLVFDWKRNYRDLLVQPAFQNLVVYTVGRDSAPFFFNPLIPPKGVAPREWIKKLIEIMQHAYFLGEGVAFVMQEVLDHLYGEFGVYEQSNQWPNFRDVLLALRARSVKGREAAWMESALRAVGVLCFGAMDWVLNSGAHMPIGRLLEQRAVLELDALTNSDKTFLIESLLLWIHHQRMHEPERERLKHVLLIEEAHHVLLKKKQELIGAEAVTDVILREIREFGEAIVLLDQLPSLISKPALENTFTTICMNLKEKGDVTAAAKAMLLESDEVRHLGRLPVGWGIVKLQARWPKPFLVGFPLFTIRKGAVTDEQVRDRFHSSVSAEEAALLMQTAAARTVSQVSQVRRAADTQSSPPELTTDEITLLRDVGEHPLSAITERYARLGWNAKKGTQSVSRLIERGMVRAMSVAVPGSHLRLLELTSAGREVLGLPATESNRRGGLEHRYWVQRIACELKAAGIEAEVEAPIGGGAAVDILVRNGSERIAIEVETGGSDWTENVRKCFAAGIDRVVTCPTNTNAREVIRSGFAQARLSRAALIQSADAARVITASLKSHVSARPSGRLPRKLDVGSRRTSRSAKSPVALRRGSRRSTTKVQWGTRTPG